MPKSYKRLRVEIKANRGVAERSSESLCETGGGETETKDKNYGLHGRRGGQKVKPGRSREILTQGTSRKTKGKCNGKLLKIEMDVTSVENWDTLKESAQS